MSSVRDPIPLAGERTLVWFVAVLSAATAIMYVLAGWRSGDMRFVVGALGPPVVDHKLVTVVIREKGDLNKTETIQGSGQDCDQG